MARPSGAQLGTPDRGREARTRPAAGRPCTRAGCDTVLSTYNTSSTCFLHTDPSYKHPLHRS
jgi:hypothetical protein